MVVKPFVVRRIMTLLTAEAPANFVPAAAVTRRGRVLFNMTGRLGHVGCFLKISEKIRVTAWGSIFLSDLSTGNRFIEFLG
jgi:hypothetical protein